MATLTAKGSPLTQSQTNYANQILSIGRTANAPTIALEAAIFAAIMESDLGVQTDWNPTYGGVLAGNVNIFGQYGAAASDAVTNAEATQFFKGGSGYNAGGAIAASAHYTDVAALAAAVESPFDAADPPPYGQYIREGGLAGIQQVVSESQAIVSALGGGSPSGGVLGTGGSGTSANIQPTTLWTVGDSSNPDEDYFTCINTYGQNAQWYVFSDGETLYVADGIQLMAQQPASVISRSDPSVMLATMTYDNTAFQYVTTHTAKGSPVRRAALAKVTSPTQVTVQQICNIDAYRAGDTVYLQQFGPGDGPWLVGQTRRSVFQPYTTLTLVQAMQPINALSGLPFAASASGGPTTGTSGTVGTTTVTGSIKVLQITANDKFPGYVNPIGTPTTLSLGRTDEGVDWHAGGSGPLLAIGNCKILNYLQGSGFFGAYGNTVVWQFLDGALAGTMMYYAEGVNIASGVSVGGTYSAGTTIANAYGGPSGIELGFAGATDGTPLYPYNGATDGTPMPGGKAFGALISALGYPYTLQVDITP